jgi:hypothetical protein
MLKHEINLSNYDNLAPISSAIRYKNVLWRSAVLDDKSLYQGLPRPENNKLWEDLYECVWHSQSHIWNYCLSCESSRHEQDPKERRYAHDQQIVADCA